ncbi:MAG: ASCH domain-containing protein [Saprospiraceae bacterium]|nr:ASCH domain-containing protein [Bacteroidia bacterium]NNL92548.1 ASCH domain-containing protein [Saprospiraceae bacterium]
MLIKLTQLKKIKDGKVSLAFRKWNNARVKKGSNIKTAVGLINIIDINKISLKDLSESEAIKAGYDNLEELQNELTSREGNLYKISLKYHSEDPRIALRNKSDLTQKEFEEIKHKLDRFDKFSKTGDWTLDVLKTISSNPKLKAGELALILGKEKSWLKTNIRKLKNLGLTISHEVGYSISAYGKLVLNKLIQA